MFRCLSSTCTNGRLVPLYLCEVNTVGFWRRGLRLSQRSHPRRTHLASAGLKFLQWLRCKHAALHYSGTQPILDCFAGWMDGSCVVVFKCLGTQVVQSSRAGCLHSATFSLLQSGYSFSRWFRIARWMDGYAEYPFLSFFLSLLSLDSYSSLV